MTSGPYTDIKRFSSSSGEDEGMAPSETDQTERGSFPSQTDTTSTSSASGQNPGTSNSDDSSVSADLIVDVIKNGTETDLQHSRGLDMWRLNWGVEKINGDLDFETIEATTGSRHQTSAVISTD